MTHHISFTHHTSSTPHPHIIPYPLIIPHHSSSYLIHSSLIKHQEQTLSLPPNKVTRTIKKKMICCAKKSNLRSAPQMCTIHFPNSQSLFILSQSLLTYFRGKWSVKLISLTCSNVLSRVVIDLQFDISD